MHSEDVVVIRSQAILASYDETVLPGEATFSVEADIVPLDDADGPRADLIDGRLKDHEFVAAIVGARLADPAEVTRLLEAAVVGADRGEQAKAVLAQLAASGLPERNRRAWWRRRADSFADRIRLAPRPRPVVLSAELPEDGSS